MEDADFETSEASGRDDSQPLEREWASRQERSWNAGFVEGLELTQGDLIQQSFARGFTDASRLGFTLGATRGALVALQHPIQRQDVALEYEADPSGDAQERSVDEGARPEEGTNSPLPSQDPLVKESFSYMYLQKGLGLDKVNVGHKTSAAAASPQPAGSFDLHASLETSLSSLVSDGINVPLSQAEVTTPKPAC